MSMGRYFQDELQHLHRTGADFANLYPGLSNYLSERSTDPDVERLLEGFAFLTGRLREKIDDQLPELTQSVLMLLWPNFLRPIPSMTILEMAAVPGAINQTQKLEAGLSVESRPIDGTSCKFRTTSPLDIHPLRLEAPRHDVSREKSVVTLPVNTLNDEAVHAIDLTDLRIFLGGAPYSALTLNLWLHRYLRAIRVVDRVHGTSALMAPEQVIQGGLGRADAVLPYPDNAFVGYRLLQEFFAFPDKYRFFTLEKLPLTHLELNATGFDLVFEFSRPLPPDLRLTESSFKLHCVSAINLFDHDAEPITLNGERSEYRLFPALRDGGQIEIFSIDRVTGWGADANGRSGAMAREYSRFESFVHEIERVDERAVVYYRERVSQPLAGRGVDRFLSFVREDEQKFTVEDETISVDITCSNANAPHGLAIGDICIPSADVPAFVRPENISRPTQALYPVVDGGLQWQLISALALNYLSLENADALRMILGIFDFGARVDRKREREAVLRLEGIEAIHSEPLDRVFKGLPVRGMRSEIKMRESKFASEGEMFLLATVLAEFFALYATVNSFHELVVHGQESGEVYRWKARIGNQPLI